MTYAPRSAPAGRSVPPARVGVYGYVPNTYGSSSGFGNVVFPGTGHAPGTYSPFSIVQPGFAAGLQGTVNGFGRGFGNGFRRFGQRSNTIVIPYGVPIYGGYAGSGYYGEPYPAPYQEQPEAGAPYGQGYGEPLPPQVIYVVPSEPDRSTSTAAPQGPVIYTVPPHNNNGNDGYVEVTPATPAAKPVYLIALKNASIYSATDYWVEDGTLHYLTTSNAHNQISLDQVDLDFTTRLNRERGVDFRLQK
jgi:hypothetical protein